MNSTDWMPSRCVAVVLAIVLSGCGAEPGSATPDAVAADTIDGDGTAEPGSVAPDATAADIVDSGGTASWDSAAAVDGDGTSVSDASEVAADVGDVATPVETGEERDPNCHHDCFGAASCSDGVVTYWQAMPVPCWAWKGQCPSTTSSCGAGEVCLKAALYSPLWQPPKLCTTPSQAGAPCQAGGLCPSPPGTQDADGTVQVTYLACDSSTNTCVAAAPPVVPDWMKHCGLPDLPASATGTTAVQETAKCGGSKCLLVRDIQAGCTRQGCTKVCTEDHHCPAGSLCVDPKDLDLAFVTVGAKDKICVPGGTAIVADALACVPPTP